MIRFLLLLSSLLIASCATVTPFVSPNSIINIYGVTAKTPRDGNWVMVATSGYQSSLASQGANENESLVVNVSIFQIPVVGSEQEFLELVVKSRAATPKTGRFENHSNAEELSRLNGALCVKYHSVSIDKNARTKDGTTSMLLESIGYNCQHPLNETVGVNIEYSSRHFEETPNLSLDEDSAEYFGNIQFTEF